LQALLEKKGTSTYTKYRKKMSRKTFGKIPPIFILDRKLARMV
jgi:hypothetical protein